MGPGRPRSQSGHSDEDRILVLPGINSYLIYLTGDLPTEDEAKLRSFPFFSHNLVRITLGNAEGSRTVEEHILTQTSTYRAND
jgi:hypothetical protein